MHKEIDKVTTMNEIVPKLPEGKWSFKPRVPIYEIVNAILYKLKTGLQWEQRPVKVLFEQDSLSWNTVYHHYGKWCKLEFGGIAGSTVITLITIGLTQLYQAGWALITQLLWPYFLRK